MEENKIKKTVYKRWWFWALIVMLVIGIIGNNTENTQTQNNDIQNTTNITQEKNEDKSEVKQETTTNIIMSNDYHNYIIDTLNKVNSNNVFNIVSSRTRSQYIEIDMQSVNRLTYNDYDIKAKDLTNKLYEQIKDKTIKKDGLLSNDYYIINLHFYERFNDNINPKKKTVIQVGIYQIHTEDLEKYRNYGRCVNGGISELEWKQERK